VNTLLGLIASHFVCDFTLQTDWIGKNKSPRSGNGIWPWVLAAHAMTHAVGIYVVTRSIPCAVAQFFAHAAIDAMKCCGVIGFHRDQCLHLLFAALLCILIKEQP